MEYQTTGERWWRNHALTRQQAIGAQTVTSDTLNLGSLYYATFARGHKLTGKAALKEVALHAATCMAARYSPVVGAMRSRPSGDHFNIIMDSIMKLPLLYWGAENGGPPEWADVAHQHALTMARDFIRADGSTYHVVNYDEATGAVTEKTTSAGIAPESMWARGQAWAVNGFATGYRKSGDPVLLEAARMVADRYLADLPADLVPYWDFRDPAIPDSPRDSSAAAIAVSGLVDLAVIDPDPARRLTYADAAREHPRRACRTPTYASLGSNPALLRRATVSYWREQTNVGAAYGDYFYLEALLRLRMLPPAVPPADRSAAPAPARAMAGSPPMAGRTPCGRRRATSASICASPSFRPRLRPYSSRCSRATGEPPRCKHPRLEGRFALERRVKATMSSGETAGFELYDFARRTARGCASSSRAPRWAGATPSQRPRLLTGADATRRQGGTPRPFAIGARVLGTSGAKSQETVMKNSLSPPARRVRLVTAVLLAIAAAPSSQPLPPSAPLRRTSSCPP